jgi:hypothetical protein
MKRQPQLRADLAQALSLAPGELCTEVGAYDCFGVHQIPLGGVEPYVLGINEPIEETAVTTPIAVERIALSACKARVDRDFADLGSAEIFRGLPVDGDGAMANADGAEARAAIDRLYKRLLQRAPTEAEAGHLAGLYGEVTTAQEPRPARSWALLSCFAVATSVEALFY